MFLWLMIGIAQTWAGVTTELQSTATLGVLTIMATEGPEMGSDTGWNRDPYIARTQPLGANKDVVLQTALGSHVREFRLFLTRSRFLQFKTMMGTVKTFTDWNGYTRSVYVLSVRRETGSRPFLYRTVISLIEQ